jgi:uracil phosphoribosyltransferase
MESKSELHVLVLEKTPQNVLLQTIVRDRDCIRENFIFYADRLIRITLEKALNLLPMQVAHITTPTGTVFAGLEPAMPICSVSIPRSGDAMEKGLRDICRAIRIGKILIQRDEETKLPKRFYAKLPDDIANRKILLLDPMLATGGTACMAIKTLIERGCMEENIIFVCLFASPEGIRRVNTDHPGVDIVAASIDTALNDDKYILPGCGDFGDRYYGTN